MIYEDLRQFADSWGLVLMGIAFVAFVGWTFLGSVSAGHRQAACSIFEQEEGRDG